MNNNSSSIKFKIGLLIPFLILTGLFVTLLIASILYSPMIIRAPPGGHYVMLYDFEFFYFTHTIISTVNIALLTVLLIIFMSIYKKTKSDFSFGLIIFGIVFLLKDLMSSPFFTGAFSYYASGLGPFIVLPDIFEFAALSVLLYLNLKY